MPGDVFETSDFPLAITLLSFGFIIENFDVTEPRKIKFLFEKTGRLEKLINDYWDNKVLVNPKTFFNAEKELKSRMHQIREVGGNA